MAEHDRIEPLGGVGVKGSKIDPPEREAPAPDELPRPLGGVTLESAPATLRQSRVVIPDGPIGGVQSTVGAVMVMGGDLVQRQKALAEDAASDDSDSDDDPEDGSDGDDESDSSDDVDGLTGRPGGLNETQTRGYDLMTEGVDDDTVAEALDVTPKTVARWRAKWEL